MPGTRDSASSKAKMPAMASDVAPSNAQDRSSVVRAVTIAVGFASAAAGENGAQSHGGGQFDGVAEVTQHLRYTARCVLS